MLSKLWRWALVESEKTAVICSALRPECIWLATGGKGQLNDRVEVLQGRRIVAFPDVDGYDVWVNKAAERPHLHITVSDYLEKTVTQQEREAHIDIADRLIALMQSESGNALPARADPPPSEIVSTNPVFLEVQKSFSPEYHSEVLALIEDLDLEFVGVTRCRKKVKDKQSNSMELDRISSSIRVFPSEKHIKSIGFVIVMC